MALGALQQFLVDPYGIGFGIGFAAKLSDGLAVHAYQSLLNQFFGFAAGSYTCRRDDFLQSFESHRTSWKSCARKTNGGQGELQRHHSDWGDSTIFSA
jgi:hypothetical protein